MEEAATPLPSDETTPPVTKMYFGAIHAARVLTPGLYALHRIDVHTIMFGTRESVKSNSLRRKNGLFSGSCRATFVRERVCNKLGTKVKSGG